MIDILPNEGDELSWYLVWHDSIFDQSVWHIVMTR